MASVLLDASAMLAHLQDEVGGRRVEDVLPGAGLTSVNASEVVSKLRQAGVGMPQPMALLEGYGVSILPFEPADVAYCAEFHASHRHHGLSMADCCCLAAAARRGLDVLTADRLWSDLDLGLRIEQIR